MNDMPLIRRQTPALDWPALIFRPLLIAALVICIAAGWVMSIEFVVAGWRGEYLIWVVALVTLETLVVERHLRRQRAFSEYRLQVRLAELGLMLLLLKCTVYFQRGWAALWADLQLWFFEPMSFIDGDYLIGAMVLLTHVAAGDRHRWLPGPAGRRTWHAGRPRRRVGRVKEPLHGRRVCFAGGGGTASPGVSPGR